MSTNSKICPLTVRHVNTTSPLNAEDWRRLQLCVMECAWWDGKQCCILTLSQLKLGVVTTHQG